MNTISVQIERLKEKLEIAIKLDRKSSSEYLEEGDRAKFYRFSGADRHNFKLNPTLSIEQIGDVINIDTKFNHVVICSKDT